MDACADPPSPQGGRGIPTRLRPWSHTQPGGRPGTIAASIRFPMATNVRVIRPSDFLRANADGRVDLEGAKGLLAKVATAAAALQDYEVLIDIRDAVGHLT